MKNHKPLFTKLALAALGITALSMLDSARANPNNSISTAAPLPLNVYSGAFQIGVAGENDYYRVDFPSPGNYTVQSEGSTDTFGYLLDATGAQVASNDDISPGVNLNFRITVDVGPGRYYVRVRHYSPMGTGSYYLRNMFTPGPPDDHGNTMNTATLVNTPTHPGYDMTVSLAGRIQYGGDVDWFRIDVPQVDGGYGLKPRGYLLSATSTGTTDLVGHLYDSTGRELAYNDDSAEYGTKNFSVGVNLGFSGSTLGPGTYYLKVHHYSTISGTGAYGVTFFLGSDDHGETIDTATWVVVLDNVSSGAAGQIRPGDKDYFRVLVPSSGFLKINCSTPYDLVGHLYDSTGRELASAHQYNGTRGNFIVRIPVTQGSYYLKLHHFSGTGSGTSGYGVYDYAMIFSQEH